jgi:hypothetical protein
MKKQRQSDIEEVIPRFPKRLRTTITISQRVPNSIGGSPASQTFRKTINVYGLPASWIARDLLSFLRRNIKRIGNKY